MSKDKLPLCPFCKSEAKIKETEWCDYVASCSGCGCYIHNDMKWSEEGYDPIKNVTEKWSTRPIESELLEVVENLKSNDFSFLKNIYYLIKDIEVAGLQESLQLAEAKQMVKDWMIELNPEVIKKAVSGE